MNKKLALSQVEEIIKRLAKGEKVKDLAEHFNVSRTPIRDIAAGKSWKFVDRTPLDNSRTRYRRLRAPEVNQIILRVARGDRYEQIAEHFNIHPRTVSKIVNGRSWPNIDRKALNGKAFGNRGACHYAALLSEEQVVWAVEAVRCGMSIAEAARKLSASYEVVRSAVRGVTWKHLNVDRPEPKPKGKLSPDQVRAIRAAYGEGVSKKALAQDYNVSRTTIHSIVMGRSYKDVK